MALCSCQSCGYCIRGILFWSTRVSLNCRFKPSFVILLHCEMSAGLLCRWTISLYDDDDDDELDELKFLKEIVIQSPIFYCRTSFTSSYCHVTSLFAYDHTEGVESIL